MTTKRTVILPWGLNPYDLPCLQKSLVHIACGNCLPGSEEPSCHLSTSSPATTSEGIGRQPVRRCYSGAKRAQDRTHSVAHLFKFSVQGRNINIFRLISKRKVKNVHFTRSFFPRDRRSNNFIFTQTYYRCPRWFWRLRDSSLIPLIQLSHPTIWHFQYFIQVFPTYFFVKNRIIG